MWTISLDDEAKGGSQFESQIKSCQIWNKREEFRSDGSRRKSSVHVNREKHGPTMSGDDDECAHRILVLFE